MDAYPILWVDRAYEVLVGSLPTLSSIPPRTRAITVMERWDGRRFDGDPQREKIARLALCEIGVWHFAYCLPYAFELIAERLREVHPVLGADEVTLEHMLDILEGETIVQG